MIAKMFECGELTKHQKRRFIPFVNQRNFMGSLLPINQKNSEERFASQTVTKNIALIENLKKSTKEYFFDKKYEKMVKKLEKIQQSNVQHGPSLDQQVDRCFETLNFAKTFHPGRRQDQRFFVDLKQQLNEKINCIKGSIITKIQSQRSNQFRRNKLMKNSNLQAQFDQSQLRATRRTQNQQSKENFDKQIEKNINRDLFKQLGKKSQFMSDFSSQGLKYKHLVQTRKINPWKKWYIQQKVEIFPGQIVTVKKLQKTIY